MRIHNVLVSILRRHISFATPDLVCDARSRLRPQISFATRHLVYDLRSRLRRLISFTTPQLVYDATSRLRRHITLPTITYLVNSRRRFQPLHPLFVTDIPNLFRLQLAQVYLFFLNDCINVEESLPPGFLSFDGVPNARQLICLKLHDTSVAHGIVCLSDHWRRQVTILSFTMC